ncbi:MAG: hypothetical protein AB1941_01325 [Gemmatimonadota bacterium]
MGEQSDTRREVLEGYVVDQACLRKYPQDELLERARVHTTECALMGHCMESGYGLVDEEGRPLLLEPAATARVVERLRSTGVEKGARLRATRVMRDGEMTTVDVTEPE